MCSKAGRIVNIRPSEATIVNTFDLDPESLSSSSRNVSLCLPVWLTAEFIKAPLVILGPLVHVDRFNLNLSINRRLKHVGYGLRFS